MSQDRPPLPSPNAPPAAVTNDKVALALLAPPSPIFPSSHWRASVANLFRDCVEIDANKRLSYLPSTGYSPTKKKGGSQTSSAGKGDIQSHRSIISPRDSFNTGNADDCVESDEEEDEDYSPTPGYKLVWATQKPKSRDPKVTLDSHYFTFLCPLTFNPKRFAPGHPQLYSEDDMRRFDANFHKQLSFNFCATRALLGRSQRHSTKLGLVDSVMLT